MNKISGKGAFIQQKNVRVKQVFSYFKSPIKKIFAKDPKKIKAYQFIYERLNNFLWYEEPFARKIHCHLFAPQSDKKVTTFTINYLLIQ